MVRGTPANRAPRPSSSRSSPRSTRTSNPAREQGFRLVVIDTPPAVTRAISEVVAHADLVIVPTRPSPHDLRAVGPTVDIIAEGRRKQMIVVNAATARAKITQEAAIALSQHGTVAPVTVHNRLDFAASMIDGRTVMEIDAMSKSASEIVDLWRYLLRAAARLEPPHQANGALAATQVYAAPDRDVRPGGFRLRAPGVRLTIRLRTIAG